MQYDFCGHLLFLYFSFYIAAILKLQIIFWSANSKCVWCQTMFLIIAPSPTLHLQNWEWLRCFYRVHHHGSKVPDICFRHKWNLYSLNFNLWCLICAQIRRSRGKFVFLLFLSISTVLHFTVCLTTMKSPFFFFFFNLHLKAASLWSLCPSVGEDSVKGLDKKDESFRA